jgi:hypothetical protein
MKHLEERGRTAFPSNVNSYFPSFDPFLSKAGGSLLYDRVPFFSLTQAKAQLHPDI